MKYEYGALVEWWEGYTEVLEEKHVPVPLYTHKYISKGPGLIEADN
jgi:hypothetical protein